MSNNRVKIAELETELPRLEDQMWEDIKLETDLFCDIFAADGHVASIEQVCFLEDSDQIRWTNIQLPPRLSNKLDRGELNLHDLGGARKKDEIDRRLPEDRESMAACYLTEDGYRAVYLLRYQPNVIWAWGVPVADEDFAAISYRCKRFNEITDAINNDLGIEPKDAAQLTSDLHMLADAFGAFLEIYQHVHTVNLNTLQDFDAEDEYGTPCNPERKSQEDDIDVIRRMIGNITGSIIENE